MTITWYFIKQNILMVQGKRRCFAREMCTFLSIRNQFEPMPSDKGLDVSRFDCTDSRETPEPAEKYIIIFLR